MGRSGMTTHDDVAWITLENSQRCNAMDTEMFLDLSRHLAQLQLRNSGARAIVITGMGSTFSSGVDLTAIRASSRGVFEDSKIARRSYVETLIDRMVSHRLPIVAAVNGPAIGTGMTLALACDLIVMNETAYFEASFLKRGLVPDGGITYLLPRRIGAARATSILMLGERLGASDALACGLACRVVASSAFHTVVLDVARQLAAAPTLCLERTRRLLGQTFDNDLRSQMERERNAQSEVLSSNDALEGIAAFLEKRTPRFRGI